MTPLECIEKGILENNLQLIASGYFQMTGKNVKQERGIDKENAPVTITPSVELNEVGYTETPPVEILEELPVFNNTEEQILDSGEEEISSEEVDGSSLLTEEQDNSGEKFKNKAKKARLGIFGEEAIEGENSVAQKQDKQCRKVQFEIKKRTNKFKDTNAVPVEDFDKKVRTNVSIEKRKEITKRSPPVKVKVQCRSCKGRFLVEPAFAPRSLGSGDSTSYMCNTCSIQGKPNAE